MLVIVSTSFKVDPAGGLQTAGYAWTVPDIATACQQLGLTRSTLAYLGPVAASLPNMPTQQQIAAYQEANIELGVIQAGLAAIGAAQQQATAPGAVGVVMITQNADGLITAGGR